MPEMPEVTTVSKYLDRDLRSRKILEAEFLNKKMIRGVNPSVLSSILKGKRILSVGNIGKHIIFEFSEKWFMISHLRMEGKYRFEKNKNLKKHDHAFLKFEDGYLIFSDTRKFGTFDLRKESELTNTPPISNLGFYPQDINLDYLRKKIKNKRINVKNFLLNQSNIVGLGNIYVDEVLWDCKINPLKIVKDLKKEEVSELIKSSIKIIDLATKHNGSTIKTYKAYNKIDGEFQNFLKVHTKKNCECERCGNKIIKIKVSGRGTYMCEKCQK